MATQVTKRPKRIPVGEARSVLTVADKDPNFHYRFVSDTDGRVNTFINAGYEVVSTATKVGDESINNTDPLGTVVQKPVGGGVNGILMRVPLEYYTEDQNAKAAEIKAKEQTMRPVDDARAPLIGSGISIKS